MKKLFFLLVFVPFPTFAAGNFVQAPATTIRASFPYHETFATPTTGGNLILVSAETIPPTKFVTSGSAGGCTITDDVGNTYNPAPASRAIETSGTNVGLETIYSTGTIAGASNITFNSCGITFAQIWISEFTPGPNGIFQLDASTSAVPSTGFMISSLTISPPTTNGLLYFANVPASVDATGINAPWITFPTDANFQTAYLINSGSSGPLSPSFVTASQTYIASAVSFAIITPVPAVSLGVNGGTLIINGGQVLIQ